MLRSDFFTYALKKDITSSTKISKFKLSFINNTALLMIVLLIIISIVIINILFNRYPYCNLRIVTGKIHPQIKLRRLGKVRICTFGQLVL